MGIVEMTIVPKRNNMRVFKVNAKQFRVYSVRLNDTYDMEYYYYDVSLMISDPEDEESNYSLDDYSLNHRNVILEQDADAGGGELICRIPAEASHLIVEGRPFRVKIEFSLDEPQGGMHFFVPSDPASPEKPHMFTTRNENNSRLWFPCIDCFSEVCTWTLEFTVEESLTAISCGELVEMVQATEGAKQKTYHYYLSTPTASPNIGLAVGPFETYVDPHMHEITHFCLPGHVHLLKWTSRFLHEMYEFYEDTLGTRFPYSCFKTVYVSEAFTDMTSYSSMSIFDANLLHTSAIIDQTYATRRFTALALAQQFYSCFISYYHSSDSWLCKGISYFLCGLYIKKVLGNNEYRFWIHEQLQEVIKYEQQYGGIVLDPSLLSNNLTYLGWGDSNSNSSSHVRPANANPTAIGGDAGFYFSLANPQTISPAYLDIYAKKSHLAIRMLEHRIGHQLLLQVLNKQLSQASLFAVQALQPGVGLLQAAQSVQNSLGKGCSKAPGTTATNPMLISTTSFTRAIFTATGKDMTVFMDQWVRQGGHVRFHLSFVFNRKRNTVELEVKQDCIQQLGVKKYVGPLTVALQELDGTFKHVLQIENTHAKADIVCHSKSRRQKKKKIPLCTGEEVDMDLTAMDADSPVLWIRLDPDMTVIRAVDTRQPDFQWQYQLRHERDVTAQIEAIWALEAYATVNTRSALTDIIENEQSYYKIRCGACHCLAKVANSMVSGWTGPPAMLTVFRKLFGSFSCPQIVKHNDFSNLQHYFLQKTIPVAMATLRNAHGICPSEVLKFILDLFKYNDNSRNRLSDNYYRAALVKAIGNTVTPVVSLLASGDITAESMSSDTRSIMEEISRCLNLEKVLQCYKFTVTVECLRALRKLQKFGHLPNNVQLFRAYANYGQFIDVRLAALEAIVDYTRSDGNLTDVEYLLDMIDKDPVPRLKHELCRLIIAALSEKTDRKRAHKSPFHHKSVALRLWNSFNVLYSVDARVRCDLIDLYYTLFGCKKLVGLQDDDGGAEFYRDETISRRKSPVHARKEAYLEDDNVVITEISNNTSKRDSLVSDNDNSGELPDALDTSLPTSFSSSMFKTQEQEIDNETMSPRSTSTEPCIVATPSTSASVVASTVAPAETSLRKHHHHHHHSNKAKKKKEKKKKHKHKHKHKHGHEHKPKKSKEETLSSASSATNSPSHM